MTTKPKPVRFSLTLRALADPQAAFHGERFDRDYGLRCESVARIEGRPE